MPESTVLTDADQVAVLGRAAELLASSTQFDATLAHTITACLPALGDFGFFDVVVDGTAASGTVRRTARAYNDPVLEALLAPTQWVRNERTDLNLCALSSGELGLHAAIDDAWYRAVAVNDGHLALLRALDFCSMLTVPMRYRGELVGALTLFYGRSRRHHTDAHCAFGEKLAALAAPVVVNARLVEHAEAAQRRLQVIASAGDKLAHSLEPRDTLDAIGAVVVPDLADWCRIDLYDEHGALVPVYTHTRDPALREQSIVFAQRFQAPATVHGSAAWIAATGQTHKLIIDDALLAQISDAGMAQFIRDVGLREMLGAPLVARDRTLGVLLVLLDRTSLGPAARSFDQGDVALLVELARRAALALDNARLYADAERARRDAEAANRAKDEFLAILGHELRNPLAPIVSALDLLDARNTSELRRERNVIRRQVTHLSRLVDDLLDVSRIVRGKVVLHREPVDVAAVVDKAVEMTRPLFAERNVTLEQVIETAWVDADPLRLAQVVANLLTNAAKFTPIGGHVIVELGAAGEPDAAGEVVLSVRDFGEGIAPELLPDIFGLFVQGQQPLDRRQGGLGLGLAIVTNLIALHGGTVDAESAGVGHGATFRVRLPRIAPPAAASSATAPRARASSAGGTHVLVVDDNEDACLMLAELLRDSGYTVSVETSARGALERATDTPPDLAILDIGLPEIDGYELARRLRALGSGHALRLVAMTGYGRDSDRERARAAGFDEHLIKPVRPERLLATLEQLLRA